MTTYYVDITGSDNNAGSAAAPFATIPKGVSIAEQGEAIIVRPGIYGRTTVDRPGITIQACGDVTCQGFVITAADTYIYDFKINTILPGWNDSIGILLKANRADIQRNQIDFCTGEGIRMDHPVGAPIADCIIRENILTRNSMDGILIAGINHLVEDNEISGTLQHHPNHTTPPSGADADGMRFFGSGHIIRGNYIHDIFYNIPENIDPHIDAFQTWVHSAYGNAHDILFEKNIVNLAGPLNTLPGAEDRAKGFQIAGAVNLEIKNNMIQAHYGMFCDASTGCLVHDNLFVCDDGVTLFKEPNGLQIKVITGWNVYNNIYLDTDLVLGEWTPDNLRLATISWLENVGK